MLSIGEYDPLLYGANDEEGLVAVEHVQKRGGQDGMALFYRRDGKIVRKADSFEPFIAAAGSVAAGCPGVMRSEGLSGNGTLDTALFFSSWKDCSKARTWFSKETGFTPSAMGAPYLCLNDPVQQYLVLTGRTLFLGMEFGDISRMQVDIECITSEGYEFCNAAREGDRIVAIGLGDDTGWMEVLSGEELDEKSLLEHFVKIVRERDPDVIEGHNIFNFDLPYIVQRAKRYKVKLALGRNGSAPTKRPSRFSVGERTISYSRFEVFGRHVVDTMFLLQAYDVSHRSLDGFGLKDAAIHFGFAAKNRTYIEGSEISA
ncbi:3'-5' exonuclease, partial [Verrucomicrobiota bacterium]